MLDPRTKLLLSLLLGGVVIRTRTPEGLAAEGALLLALVVLHRQGRAYLSWLRMLLPTAAFFAGVMALAAGPVEGLEAGLRLWVLTSVFFLFFALTRPEDLGNALVQWGLPFPVAFVTTAALQFVPVVTRKARSVMDAQRSRGLSLEPGLRTLWRYPRFLVPVLVQAFQMADELAEAMEARGFGRRPRSSLHRHRMGWRDASALGAGAVMAAAWLWWLGRVAP
jgi:energy-coupling factor transport system permease protein